MTYHHYRKCDYKITKLYNPLRKLKTGNKSPVLFIKKPLCKAKLSSAHKIFMERP